MEKKFSIRTFLRLLVFLAILLVLFGILSVFYEKAARSEMEGKRHRIKDYVYTDLKNLREDSIDVVAMGDSLAFTTFSPMQLWRDTGIPGYTASVTGSNMAEIESVLKAVLQRQKPKVIFLETHCMYWNMKDSPEEILAVEQAKTIFPMLRYHNLWKNAIVKQEVSKRFWYGFRIMNQQFAVRDSTMQQYMQPDDREDDSITKDDIRVMKSFGEICRKNGVLLILYSAPSPKNYSMRSHNTISKLADEMEVTYLDMNLMNDELGINWETDTNDRGDHLNIIGATKVTRYMTGYITDQLQNLGFEDHRQDPDYGAMNKKAKKFSKVAARFLKKMEASEEALKEFT